MTTISHNLHNTNSELDKSNKMQNRLLSIFAHDIKNPFSSIVIQNKNLLDEYNNLNDYKRINAIYKIYISTQKIYKHFSDLLDWSRSHTNNIKCKIISVNLKKVSDDIISLFENKCDKKGVKIFNSFDKNNAKKSVLCLQY